MYYWEDDYKVKICRRHSGLVADNEKDLLCLLDIIVQENLKMENKTECQQNYNKSYNNKKNYTNMQSCSKWYRFETDGMVQTLEIHDNSRWKIGEEDISR